MRRHEYWMPGSRAKIEVERVLHCFRDMLRRVFTSRQNHGNALSAKKDHTKLLTPLTLEPVAGPEGG